MTDFPGTANRATTSGPDTPPATADPAGRLHAAERTFLVRDPGQPNLFVRWLPPQSTGRDQPGWDQPGWDQPTGRDQHTGRDQPTRHALYVHGATFPSALSVAYPFDGRSWSAELAASGINAWAFDMTGYGHSERYVEQDQDPEGRPPLGRAAAAGEQLERVVEFLRRDHGVERISLVSHSWGSMPTGLFAARRPELVDRIVLFGPIGERLPAADRDPDDLGGLQSADNLGSWYPLTVEAQYHRFVDDVPAGHPRVLCAEFDQWAETWLDTDATSRTTDPPRVRTPSGPIADIAGAWSGELAWDPALVQAPTCIIRGAWDSLCTDDDARWLFDALARSPIRRDVKISAATHLMHLEANRHALYRETITFLLGADTPRTD